MWRHRKILRIRGENEAVLSSDEDEEEEEIVTGMEKEFGDKDSEEEEVQPEDN